jgi:hypothetical protein
MTRWKSSGSVYVVCDREVGKKTDSRAGKGESFSQALSVLQIGVNESRCRCKCPCKSLQDEPQKAQRPPLGVKAWPVPDTGLRLGGPCNFRTPPLLCWANRPVTIPCFPCFACPAINSAPQVICPLIHSFAVVHGHQRHCGPAAARHETSQTDNECRNLARDKRMS